MRLLLLFIRPNAGVALVVAAAVINIHVPPRSSVINIHVPPLGSTAAIIVIAASAQVAHPILWLPQKKTEWNIVVRIVAAIGHSHHQCPNVRVLRSCVACCV
jgi:hypothetical protein